ncbi:MAG: aldehyde ferredoxin oxidoreductase family protein [Thermoleophilia bacterium]
MEQSGDILEIDLYRDDFRRHPYTEEQARFVLGGRGLNALTLLRETDSEVDPLSPHNPLLITAGLLTNTAAPSSSRLHVGARSPLTGIIGSSSVGGRAGPALRSNGFLGLVLRERSPRPVYVFIENGRAELRDAADLWGLDTGEAAERLLSRHGEEGLAMLLVGPAGENQVPLACLVTGRGHAAGRTGMGAVMGSKRVKAIVMRRRRGPARTTPEARAAVKRYLDKIIHSPMYEQWVRYGSTAAIEWTDQMGMLSTRNYRSGTFEGASAIDGKNIEPHVERTRACHRCPVHCKAELRIASGRYEGLTAERPEYEPLIAWGSKCGLSDLEAIIYLHSLADRLGLDSVSTGGVVAFAMDLYDRGIVTKEHTGGLELGWGSVPAMEELIKQIAAREGFGEVLSGGTRRAAAIIGKGAEEFAAQVKGLELPAMDPRGAYGSGLGYAVSSRGGDYTSVYSRHEWSITPERAKYLYGDERAADRLAPQGKAALVRRAMIASAVVDCLGICKVPSLSLINEYDLLNEAELLRALSGLDLSSEELFLIGERVIALERLFNARFAPMETGSRLDSVPERFLREGLPDGPAAGRPFPLEEMLSEFYEVMGYGPDGLPTRDKLNELGLDEFADEVERGRRKAGVAVQEER